MFARQFGEPVTIWPEADGTRTLEYNRQPMGHQKLHDHHWHRWHDERPAPSAHAQRFAQVQVGMGQEQVRRLLGNRPNA